MAEIRLMRLTVLLIVFAVGGVSFSAGACETASSSDVKFPLQVTSGEHFLRDAAGRPFFLHGDTAWSLMGQPTLEQADAYLRDRKKRGFNTVLVNLIESRFASNAPANAYGERPFLSDRPYEVFNDAYFDHAMNIVERASCLGIVILLAPSYLGAGGGDEGWYEAMTEAGPEALYKYGEYVGRRFGHLHNIIWVQGGDFDPPDKELVRAIAEGIRKVSPHALQTAHTSVGGAAADVWGSESWLSVDSIYPSKDASRVTAMSQREYRKGPPFIFLEGMYENNPWTCVCVSAEPGNRQDIRGEGLGIRMQAYQAVLSGAAGHVFGNNPIWHFDGPGWHPVPFEWREQLDSPGARAMTVLQKLVTSTKWWLMRPDFENQLLVEGSGPEKLRAVAFRAVDGSFALIYTPEARRLIIDLSQLDGPHVKAAWHDPVSGKISRIHGSRLPTGTQVFLPEEKNSGGASDWLLELVSVP